MFQSSDLDILKLGIMLNKAYPNIKTDFRLYLVDSGSEYIATVKQHTFDFYATKMDLSEPPLFPDVEFHYFVCITTEYRAYYQEDTNILYLQHRKTF